MARLPKQVRAPGVSRVALERAHVDRVCKQLVEFHHHKPGLDEITLARTLEALARFRGPPFDAAVRNRAKRLSQLFCRWFSDDEWSGEALGARKLKAQMLIEIYRLCGALRLPAEVDAVRLARRELNDGPFRPAWLAGAAVLEQGLTVATTLLDAASLTPDRTHAAECHLNVRDLLRTLAQLASRLQLTGTETAAFNAGLIELETRLREEAAWLGKPPAE